MLLGVVVTWKPDSVKPCQLTADICQQCQHDRHSYSFPLYYVTFQVHYLVLLSLPCYFQAYVPRDGVGVEWYTGGMAIRYGPSILVHQVYLVRST